MSSLKIISESGNFDGLRDHKSDCINIRMSEFNNPRNIRIVSSSNRVRTIRLLIDAKCGNERNLYKYLSDIQAKNPNAEFHINIEFDKFFEDAKRIMSNSNFAKKSITLWADNELKDRSYLNLSNLPCPTIIPLQYAMWHSKIEQSDSNNLYFSREDIEVRDGSMPFAERHNFEINGVKRNWSSGSNLYKLNHVLKIKRTVFGVLNGELRDIQVCSLAPDQKVLFVMKYLTDNYTYRENPKIGSMSLSNPELAKTADIVLKTKQGVCKGLAEAYMLLLNNPIVGVDCRVLGGYADKNNPDTGHAWNVVRLQDESKKNSEKHIWAYFDTSYNVELHNCFAYSFLKKVDMSDRAIYDGIKPRYDDSANIYFSSNVMLARLEDALIRIFNAKKGINQMRIITPLEDIPRHGV